MAFHPIPTDEAIRRIQERDHVEADTHGMSYENEDALIALLRLGTIVAGYDPETRKLAFTRLNGR